MLSGIHLKSYMAYNKGCLKDHHLPYIPIQELRSQGEAIPECSFINQRSSFGGQMRDSPIWSL